MKNYNYITVREAAQKWDISMRRVQILCSQNRIPDAERIGRMWVIPSDAEKPKDRREKTGLYKNFRKKETESLIRRIS